MKRTIKTALKYAFAVFATMFAVQIIKDAVNPNMVWSTGGDYGFITVFDSGLSVVTVSGKWIEGGRQCTVQDINSGFEMKKSELFGADKITYFSNLDIEIIGRTVKSVYGSLVQIDESDWYKKYSESVIWISEPREAFVECFKKMEWGNYEDPS